MMDSPLFLVARAVADAAEGKPVDVPAVRARLRAGGDQIGATARHVPGLGPLAGSTGAFDAVLDHLEAGDVAAAQAAIEVALDQFGKDQP